MKFERNHLYHIYNQGNNRERVYYTKQNYLFFISKIRECFSQYVDILAWCLMPNHFHLMVYIKSTETVVQSERENDNSMIKRSLNNSIAILLRSYTNTINREQGRTGSLFRQKTKAVCLDPDNGFMPAWYTVTGLTKINYQNDDSQYPQMCFNYIHNNPVVSGLVKDISSWEYSSVPELLGLVETNLINRKRVEEFGLKLYPSDEPIGSADPIGSYLPQLPFSFPEQEHCP